MNIPTKPSDKHKPCLEDRETIDPTHAMARLTILLGTDRLIRLVELLEDVINETGHGDVRIIISEGKVELLKAGHSYK